MLLKDKYEVVVNFIPGLKEESFRNGVGAYEGVCMHATAVYNDSDTGERSYETRHWEEAFVHTFTDEDSSTQVASYSFISYGCNHTGNSFLLNNELCQSHDYKTFLLGYDRWIWLAATQLYARRLGVVDKKTIWSHKGVNDVYHEGDHTDPISYLAEHGKTWADVVHDVATYYTQLEEEDRMLEELIDRIIVLEQKVSAPAWFTKEFGTSALNGILLDQTGSIEFWRTLAVILRLFLKKGV